jgi:hypothetical protein
MTAGLLASHSASTNPTAGGAAVRRPTNRFAARPSEDWGTPDLVGRDPPNQRRSAASTVTRPPVPTLILCC